MMACTCSPSYTGRVNRKIIVQAGLVVNMRPYLKNNQIKKGWGHGSRGRVLA
jgi:hypothetical protein